MRPPLAGRVVLDAPQLTGIDDLVGHPPLTDSARIRFVACFWPEKMSKDVEKVPLAVVLAHFENIFISKSVVGMNFRLVEYFLFLDEKIGYILRF